MEYKDIKVESKNYISTITLNRPETLNVFTSNLARELNCALRELDEDKGTRVVVIKGAGRGFSAGIDLKELKSKKKTIDYFNTTVLMEEMILTIANMKKPVIASVHGFAVANGAGLVAACDLAIAAEGTKFGITAINVGLSCIGPAVAVSKSLGRKKTLELLLTGKTIDANEAERIGFINKVVSQEKLEEETMKLAEELASKSPLALQITKRAFYKMADIEISKALEIANAHFAMICTLEDAEEGINAYLEKRTPEWKLR